MTHSVGRVFRVRNWDHHESDLIWKFGLGRQAKASKSVLVMVCLGEEPYDGLQPLDLNEVMDRLGWIRKNLPES